MLKTSAGSSREQDYIEQRSGSVEIKMMDEVNGVTTPRRPLYNNKPVNIYGQPKGKCTTIDVCSLLDTFIEIEKSQEMRKILTAKSVDCEKLRYLGEKSVINEADEFDSFIEGTNIPKSCLIRMSSMINFKRNFDSLKEGLEGIEGVEEAE